MEDGYIKRGLKFMLKDGRLIDQANSGSQVRFDSAGQYTTDHNGRTNKGFVTKYLTGRLGEVLYINPPVVLGQSYSLAYGLTYKNQGAYAGTLERIVSTRWLYFTAAQQLFLYIYKSDLYPAIYQAISTFTFVENNNYFITVSCDNINKKIKVYVNEQQILDYTISGDFADTNTTQIHKMLGDNGGGSDRYCYSMLDTFLQYNSVLTQEEHLYNYNYWRTH